MMLVAPVLLYFCFKQLLGCWGSSHLPAVLLQWFSQMFSLCVWVFFFIFKAYYYYYYLKGKEKEKGKMREERERERRKKRENLPLAGSCPNNHTSQSWAGLKLPGSSCRRGLFQVSQEAAGPSSTGLSSTVFPGTLVWCWIRARAARIWIGTYIGCWHCSPISLSWIPGRYYPHQMKWGDTSFSLPSAFHFLV